MRLTAFCILAILLAACTGTPQATSASGSLERSYQALSARLAL